MSKPEKPANAEPWRGLFGAVIWTSLHALLWMALAVALIMVVPRYDKMFADFDTELPAMTRQLVQVAAFARAYWYVFLAVLAGGLLGDYIVLLNLGKSGTLLRNLWGIAVALPPILFIAFAAVAIWMPYQATLDALV